MADMEEEWVGASVVEEVPGLVLGDILLPGRMLAEVEEDFPGAGLRMYQ